jgi:excisionase family DNA binding protein
MTVPSGPSLELEVLTVEQAAEYLQVHRATLYRYIREGLLPAVRLGKVYRLLRSDVEAFVQARRVGGGPGVGVPR